MDKINLLRASHLESLIIPSHGETLLTYLEAHSLISEGRIPACAGRLNTEAKNKKDKISLPTKQRINPASPAGGKVTKKHSFSHSLRSLASALVVISLGGMTAPIIPEIRLESLYALSRVKQAVIQTVSPTQALPPSAPVLFNPLITPDGSTITPIDSNFSVIVPKVGINAAVLPSVDPKNPAKYQEALQKGVAHSSTSFFPDQDGMVYLFSHSTNFDWFVKDLNAVFYHLKTLDTGDYIIIVYKNVRYTYKLREKKVVSPLEISYLVPQPGTKTLVLQTCWPPGSTAERLLIFADFIEATAL